ncbi:MAG: hypothetical protein ACTFAL_10060 [Candidatus Electronema sp. V4]|uniref:hypothetical protein n=1 Tax=Candidatus Electronema sp. V4 TaxID=3454756 RepID=UPI0040555108
MTIKEQLDQYRWCMCLIKNRIDFLHELLKGKDGSASTGFLLPDIELGAVQIRKVLELIAMANMTANHNEYTQITESFKK